MSANLIEAVRDCLKQGLDSASEIKHRTGLPIESVYEALVKLEGWGHARVIVPGHQRHIASWSAL